MAATNRLPRIDHSTRSPAEDYLDNLPSQRSAETMRSCLNRLSKILGLESFMQADWSQLRRSHCQYAMAVLKTQGLAPSTRNVYLATLKGVAREAYNSGLMPLSAYARIKDLQAVHYERLPVGFSLTLRQCKRLLAACDDGTLRGARDKALLAVMMGCGLRRAEAVSLTLESWDAKDQSLKFVGKGNKERKVFLPTDLLDIMNTWLEIRGLEEGALFPRMKPGKLEKEEFVFTNMQPMSIYRIILRRSQIAKIDNLRPHDLRRTFATRMLDAGCDIVILQRAMGHSSPTTTARYDRRPEKSRERICKALKFS